MKKIILITLSISLFVEGDYLAHPKSQALIDELVTNHGFEQSFVEDVLSNAVRQQKIIDSISKPAEFTWTWDRYKKLFHKKGIERTIKPKDVKINFQLNPAKNKI